LNMHIIFKSVYLKLPKFSSCLTKLQLAKGGSFFWVTVYIFCHSASTHLLLTMA